MSRAPVVVVADEADALVTAGIQVASLSFKQKFAQFINGLIFIAGPVGAVYGMVMIAKFIDSHFKVAKATDLRVGNPACWDDGDSSAIFEVVTCASTFCSKLPTLSDVNDWLNRHPIDLSGISSSDVFTKCQAYFAQCASSSGFTKAFNQGQDSAFDLNCDHTFTNLGEGFSWTGYAILTAITLAASVYTLRQSYNCMSALFCNTNTDNAVVTGTVVPPLAETTAEVRVSPDTNAEPLYPDALPVGYQQV